MLHTARRLWKPPRQVLFRLSERSEGSIVDAPCKLRISIFVARHSPLLSCCAVTRTSVPVEMELTAVFCRSVAGTVSE